MATTGFWPVRGRLKEVIDYANNPDKTTAKKYLDEDLYAAIRYVENDDKTDQTMFVSGINCSKHNAYNEMIAVKRRFGERGKNIAYHGYQSFVADEVTPSEAHRIGVETAKRMWGAKYQVVVTTHLNTDNIHNHFVVNSVAFTDGRKFRNGIGDRLELRKISDAICRQRQKSVIETHKFYSNKKEYWISKSGGLSRRDMLRRDLDEAISKSGSFAEMEYYLKCLGYRFSRDYNYAHISVIADGWKRAIRLDSLGEKYRTENLREVLVANQYKPELYAIQPPMYKRTPLLVIEYELRQARRKDTVQLIFELFIELLKICTGNNVEQQQSRPLSPMMRAEVRKLDKYLEEYKLLCDQHIESLEGLVAFKDNISAQITALEQERYAVQLKIRRAKTPEADAALKEQAKDITRQITPLRKQRDIAIRIEERIPKMQELLEGERNIEMQRNHLVKKRERSSER